MKNRILLLLVIVVVQVQFSMAQRKGINWMADGLSYTKVKDGNIIKVDQKTEAENVLIKKEQLVPKGATEALLPQAYFFSQDNNKLLLFVNTAKVWRYNTRGDYWVMDMARKELRKLGSGLPSQSLMFAKFSPDGRNVAYVSEHNLFSEDVSTGIIKKQIGRASCRERV